MSVPEPTVADKNEYYFKGGAWADDEEEESGYEGDQLPVPEEPEGLADQDEQKTHVPVLRTQEEKKLLSDTGINSHVITLVAEQVARLLSTKSGPQSLLVAAMKNTLDARDDDIKGWLDAQHSEESIRAAKERTDAFTRLDKRIDDLYARIAAIEQEQQASSMQYMEGLKTAADELRAERKKLQKEEVQDNVSDAKSDKSRAVGIEELLARAQAELRSKAPLAPPTVTKKKNRRPTVPL